MTELKSPFRYDYVGSFLRPAAVKEARAKFAKNEITKEQLTEVENEEIKKLVEKQKAAGFHGLTDGEFRRSYWHLDFMWGCRNIQFDDCTWGMFCDKKYWEARQKDASVTFESEAEKYLRVNNLALQDRPEGLTITTHVCRGNYHSAWASRGGYAPVAPYLFAKENVDAFYLEFDDERSGNFEPLKYVPEDKKVVLGLITTKSPELEDEEEVKARIREAAQYHPLDKLCLSPQCGFASCEIGNKLTEEEQWAKLALVKKIAEEVWG